MARRATPDRSARLGELSGGACAARMARAQLFVSPAIYEPFGLSVLEAARLGPALVLADIATFRELWSGAAVFFPPHDSASLAAAINRLIDDTALRRTLAANARERAARYSLDAQARATVQAWSRLSGKHSLAA